MNLVGVISTVVLSLTLGVAGPAYAQEEQHGQKEEQKAKPEEQKAKPAQQDEKKAQPEKQSQHEQKPAAGQEKTQTHNPPLLFQLTIDPSERINVADQHPDVIEQLLKDIEKHRGDLKPGKPQR